MCDLHNDDKLQLHGKAGHWETVASLRAAGYTEDELAIAADWGAVERHGKHYTVRELAERRTTEADAPSFPSPNPYKGPLDAMRAASANAAPDFEATWKANRERELAAEHARLNEHLDAHPTLRTTEGQKTYPSPNPYEAGIDALRARDLRAAAAKENRR